MTDVTELLSSIESGNQVAAEELLPLVYGELRKLAAAKLAQENVGQTLQGTALVHEAYLRLAGGQQKWTGRGHFFAAAAESMRRILVERARHKQTQKRGGGRHKEEAQAELLADPQELSPLETLSIDEILDRLAAASPRKAQLVKLRYFLGCTMAEAADVLGIALGTAEEDWTYARAWLRREFLRGEK